MTDCVIRSPRIDELEHYGPVTALRNHNKILFCGCGPILKVFDISSSHPQLVFQQKVLSRNKIHTIAITDDGKQLFAGGGRSFVIIDIENILKGENNVFKEKAIDEWIVSGEFLNQNTLLILTAHNTVYEINTQSFELKNTMDCGEKSILYSGTIRIDTNGRVLIGAGTVMEGVILWDYKTGKILHNLTEHEGSIFGIKIDPSGKFAVSCSDDRSIKLYDVQLGNILATGWGHGSRIWGLEFFSVGETLHVFSHGEDTTARLWKYQLGNTSLDQVHIWENCHSGKHIWSGCVSMESSACITGGADGRVRLLDMVPYLSKSTLHYSLEDIAGYTGVHFEKNEIIKQFFELEDGLVSITSHGTIFSYSYSSHNWREIKLTSDEKQKFMNFSIMRGFKDAGTVAITTRVGDILLLQFQSINETPTKIWIEDEYLQSSKVTNLLSFGCNGQYYLLTDCPNPKTPFVLREFHLSSGEFRLKSTTCLSQPQQTSFTTTCMVVDSVNNWLILASRYVTIAIYDLGSTENQPTPLSAIFKKIASGDTITSLSTLMAAKNCSTLLLTVRDGEYATITLRKDNTLTYDIDLENKLSRGFIEGGFFDGDNLIVYGFKSSSFFIWNETQQLELMSVACGGAHRQWELYRNESEYKFVYMNKSTIYFADASKRFENNGVLVDGTHGREIRDIAVSKWESGNNYRDVITASEDTTLRYGRLFPNGKVHVYWTLNKHVSGLQKVKFIDSNLVGSCAANEEFIVWKLSGTKIPSIADFAVLPTEHKNPDLRIMDFDSIEVDGELLIATVYSDSQIKVWKFDEKPQKFTLVLEGTYTTCCLLHVKFLRVAGNIFLTTAATDGHLAIWKMPNLSNKANLPAPLIKQQIHQNSIKGLAFEEVTGDHYRVFTGGDDNSLIVSDLKFGSEEISLSLLDFQESAASSTITSVTLIGTAKVMTVSVDQIVRLWSFESDKLVCISETYTTIADTGCSEATEIGNLLMLLVGGSGLSTFKVSN